MQRVNIPHNDQHPIVLYKPKSGGEIIAEYATISALASIDSLNHSLITKAIHRRGSYFSKYHNQKVAPRFKKP